ncbi:MAG: 3-hydroxyacyl-CoA dehydrogenase [Firmicutes bacterium]|nr:3-hydroxyacyl-CoA dehydrogenase [Bacillota bacterium]
MKNITILGGGVLGSQIAFQTSYSGYNVTIYLRSKESIKRCKKKLEEVKNSYIEAINIMKKNKDINNWSLGIEDFDNFNASKCLKKVNMVLDEIKLELNLDKALKDTDLVIESMSEDFNAKKEIYESIKDKLDDKTIIVTNSSTMLPSKLAKYTGRSDKFLALHFANSIWKNNIVEVMRHDKTSEYAFNEVIDFAKSIRMIPLPLNKEKSGYLLNSMLIPLLFSGLDLLVNGISDVKSIDTAWKRGTGSPKGPFEILDTVGLKTAYNIVLMYVKIPKFLAPYNFKGMESLLKKYIEEGKLGKSSGEGFYKYDI